MRVVTCGASSIANINNFGDELLARIYQSWIEEWSPDIRTAHLEFDKRGRLTPESLSMLAGADLLVYVGGGYFGEGRGYGRYRLRRHLWAMRNDRIYGGVYRAAQRCGVKHVVLGLEVGPVTNRLYRRTITNILTEAEDVTVRNSESADFVNAWCGDRVRVKHHIDAALSVNRSEFGAGELTGQRTVAAERSGALLVGLHLHEISDSAVAMAFHKVMERVEVAANRPVRFLYLHDQRKGGKHAPRSERAESMLRREQPTIETIPYRSPEETVGAISALDLVITTKLHVGIVGRALDVPVLSVPHHPKTVRFYRAIGEEQMCGRIQDFAKFGLPSQVVELLSQSSTSVRLEVNRSAKLDSLVNREVLHNTLRRLRGETAMPKV